MIKDILENNQDVRANTTKLAALREHFAGCFTSDGAFDMERFKEMLRDEVDVKSEGYSLNFLGKDYANLIASVDTTTVVVPDVEHNSKPENKDSENVYISGDNLDALKHLLKSYAGQVKCIYIDPPYNTGTDGFVYNDRFSFTSEQLQKRLSVDEDEAKRILDMTSRGSSTHSAWLMFMSPRLQLARQLLSKDGVIFISIDDNEQANLKLLCDYVFGEENCLGCIVRPTGQTTGQDSGGLGSSFDYILVYSKNPEYELNGLELTEKDKKRFENEDEVGKYAYDQLRKTGSNDKREDRPNMYYAIKNPDGEDLYPTAQEGYDSRWRVEYNTYKNLEANGFILWKKTKRDGKEIWWPYVKYYLEGRTKRPSPLWMDLEGNKKAARDLRELFDGYKVFDYPKPLQLIKRIIQISTDKDSIVLDFFGGSSTTAHAIMEFNKENINSYRKYILVQWQEEINSESEATVYMGYRTIDQIGQERIKRAAAKIKAENPLFAGDLGFKHYTLKEVPENVLDKMEEFNPEEATFGNNMLELFGRETVLATWKVRDGYGLTSEVEEVQLADYVAYQCGDHLYLLDEGLSDDAITAMVDKYGEPTPWNPHHVVLFGYNMNFGVQDALKTNLPLLNEGEKQVKINIDVRY